MGLLTLSSFRRSIRRFNSQVSYLRNLVESKQLQNTLFIAPHHNASLLNVPDRTCLYATATEVEYRASTSKNCPWTKL